MFHVERKDEFLTRIIKAAFPDYRGNKIRITVQAAVNITANNYWSGGSRTYLAFVNLETLESVTLPTQGPFDRKVRQVFQTQVAEDGSLQLPHNVVCVAHEYFCGKDIRIFISVSPANTANLLPEKVQLDWAETVVLAATRSLKSSYAGVKNYRFLEAKRITGITRDQYEEAKATLVQRGLLNRAGAINPAGRNAIGWTNLVYLRKEQKDLLQNYDPS